jgi:RTA1 like protein
MNIPRKADMVTAMVDAASQCPGTSLINISIVNFGRLMPSALDDPAMQWPYCPSLPTAIALTACFAALTVAHLSQAIIYRKRFCWVICMAAAWETGGFTMRLLGARDPRTQAFSIGSNLLILLSPLWVNAFAYMVVGRMIYYWLPNKSVWKLKARTITSWFVWLDVITFLVQATGGSMIENKDAGEARLGLTICLSSPAHVRRCF